MAKRLAQVYGPWRFNSLSIGSDNGDPYGWNALPFNFPLNQSHGLITQTSARCQENGIDLILYKTGSNLRCIDFQ